MIKDSNWLIYDYLLYGDKCNLKEEIKSFSKNSILLYQEIEKIPEEIFQKFGKEGEILNKEDLLEKMIDSLVSGLEEKIEKGIYDGLNEIFDDIRS